MQRFQDLKERWKMRDNWIRNSSGIWFNLDAIECVEILEYNFEDIHEFQIIAYTLHDAFTVDEFETKMFKTKKEAQDHLDKMMQQKIWD